MIIAYLTNEYGRASDTFIRGEVEQLRKLGHEVHTFSPRRPSPDELVGEEVRQAQQTTEYLLDPDALGTTSHGGPGRARRSVTSPGRMLFERSPASHADLHAGAASSPLAGGLPAGGCPAGRAAAGQGGGAAAQSHGQRQRLRGDATSTQHRGRHSDTSHSPRSPPVWRVARCSRSRCRSTMS